MMTDKWKRMEQELEQLKDNNLFRSMTVFDSPQTSQVEGEGEKQHLFSYNSYLDLCWEPKIKE